VIQDGCYSDRRNFNFIQHKTNVLFMMEERKKRHTLLKIEAHSRDKFYTLKYLGKVHNKSSIIEQQEIFFRFSQILEDSKISFLLLLSLLENNLAGVNFIQNSLTLFISQILMDL
jgi:hypothetical protein